MVEAPLHTVWLEGAVADGVGLTVIVKLFVGPLQVAVPVNTGVTVIVATTGELVPFVAVNPLMLPVPLVASPIEPVSLVQV
jgi:hypothetical protein